MALRQKRCIITGITGMVGSHLLDFLIENTNWEIYGLCRWRSPMTNIEHQIPRINRGERIFLIYGDLRDSASIDVVVEKARPDYVFHLAAQSYPKTSFDSPLDTYETNVHGTDRVEAAFTSDNLNQRSAVVTSRAKNLQHAA